MPVIRRATRDIVQIGSKFYAEKRGIASAIHSDGRDKSTLP